MDPERAILADARRQFAGSAQLDFVSNEQLTARVQHDRRRGPRLRGQNADLPERHRRLIAPIAGAADGEEIARLNGVVAAEVDLDEVALDEAELPLARVDDVAAG